MPSTDAPPLAFRRLRPGDAPAVKVMTRDVWEGRDYMGRVIDRWIGDSESCTFGAFAGEQLAGMGRIRWLPGGIAWLEGGRVRPDLQQTGIGTRLVEHALELATRHGARRARYDTYSRNDGSMALAAAFGFTEVQRLHVLSAPVETIARHPVPPGELVPVDARPAVELLLHVENPPDPDLCVGWAFVPLDPGYVERSNQGWRFFTMPGAVLVAIGGDGAPLIESPPPGEAWIVAHGTPAAIKHAVALHVAREVAGTNVDTISIFCPAAAAGAALELGFTYWDDQVGWIVELDLALPARARDR